VQTCALPIYLASPIARPGRQAVRLSRPRRLVAGTPGAPSVGHHDLAVRLFQSRQFPSWGYEVENGATTIWERWNSYTKDKGFFAPAMNSYSHYAFGAVSEWLFYRLAGIRAASPGYQRIAIAPEPPSPGLQPRPAAHRLG